MRIQYVEHIPEVFSLPVTSFQLVFLFSSASGSIDRVIQTVDIEFENVIPLLDKRKTDRTYSSFCTADSVRATTG
jgi:hypothetical protein